MKRLCVALWCAGLAWGQCSAVSEGWDWTYGSHFNGFKWFPNSRIWQRVDGANATVDTANSDNYIREWTAWQTSAYDSMTWITLGPLMSNTRWIDHDPNTGDPCVGCGYQPSIELQVVDGSKQPRVNVYCGGIATEGGSPQCYGHDPSSVPMPIPPNPRVQGKCYKPGQGCASYNTDGDKHVIVLDKSDCVMYELYNTFVDPQGKLHASSVAIFDALGGDNQRPYGWTSGSQSGTAWWMGGVRYEEVAAGHIDHAIGMIGWGPGGVNSRYFDSAIASNGQWNGARVMPYGTRVRMKSGVDISGYSPQSRVILQALKTYGGYIIDGGRTDILVEGTEQWDWPNTLDMKQFNIFTPTNFEVVTAGGTIGSINDSSTWPTGSAPTFTSFTANGTAGNVTISKGQSVTLAWTATGVDTTRSNLAYVDYKGIVRGAAAGSTTVQPVRTTTYRVHLMHRFGQADSVARTVTVN